MSKFATMFVPELQSLYTVAMQKYHTTGTSPLTDTEFDELKRTLRVRFPGDPLLNLVGAPAPADSHLQKAKHVIHMGSVTNSDKFGETYEDGFNKWFDKTVTNEPFVAMLKVDGLSVELVYESGRLLRAVTRGDGIEGEDITANVIHAKDFPLFIEKPIGNFCVRAELVILASEWEQLKSISGLTTARNAASGIARRKTEENAEYLHVVAHELVLGDGEHPEYESSNFSYWNRLQVLKFLGFTLPTRERISSKADAKRFQSDVAMNRASMPYEIDGIVFTLDDTEKVKKLGIDGEACYRGQVAWKFAAQSNGTILNDVTWTLGHTGSIIPNAVLEPVEVGGVIVSSATLHNVDQIRRLGIKIGDKVEVSRRGDTIPCCEGVLETYADSKPIVIPVKCPGCGGEVSTKTNVDGEQGVALYCLNPECDAKSTGKIKRWITSLGIKEIGDEVLQAMVEPMPGTGSPLVANIADLYRLHTAKEFLDTLQVNGRTLGKKRAATILAEIAKTTELTVDEFIGSLGVFQLGKRKAQLIREAGQIIIYDGAEHRILDDVHNWFRKTSTFDPGLSSEETVVTGKSELCMHRTALGIPNTAERMQDELDSKKALAMDLLKYITIKGPEKKVAPVAGSKFAGKSVCFTGCRPTDGEETMMMGLGIEVKSGVSKGLTWLVTKEESSTSSKAVKARALGTEVISYAKYKEMII